MRAFSDTSESNALSTPLQATTRQDGYPKNCQVFHCIDGSSVVSSYRDKVVRSKPTSLAGSRKASLTEGEDASKAQQSTIERKVKSPVLCSIDQ